MIARHDVPADPALRQLALALDGPAMVPHWQGALGPASCWQVTGCEVARVKYRPLRNASIAYELALVHRDDGRRLSLPLAARLCRDGDAARRAARARTAAVALQPGLAGPALLHLPELDLVAWCWPNDPRLRAPAWLADPVRLHGTLLADVARWLDQSAAAPQAQLSVVQYVPEHRLCVRADLGGRSAYGKAGPGSAQAHALLAAVQASPAWREGRLCTPPALGWHDGPDMHWQLGLPGVPLQALSPGQAARDGARLMASLGSQLAALHALPLAWPRQIGADALALALREALAVLRATLPARGRQIDALGAALAAGLAHLAGEPGATLHGDLHPGNLLVAGDALALIDLDGLRGGPALLELGAWQADRLYRAALGGRAPDRAADDAWLAAYQRAGGRRPGAAALAWATAWQLVVLRAWRCVVNLKPGRLGLLPRLLDIASHHLAAPRQEAA